MKDITWTDFVRDLRGGRFCRTWHGHDIAVVYEIPHRRVRCASGIGFAGVCMIMAGDCPSLLTLRPDGCRLWFVRGVKPCRSAV
jgi:hypothetical protein